MPMPPVIGIGNRHYHQVSCSRPYFLIAAGTYVSFGCGKGLDLSFFGEQAAQRIVHQFDFGEEVDPHGTFFGHTASMTKKKRL